MKELTKYVKLFQEGKISEKEIRDKIVLEVFYYLKNNSRISDDNVQNIISFFMDNAVKIAKNFDIRTNSSFSFYLLKTIKFKILTEQKMSKSYKKYNYLNYSLFESTQTQYYCAEEPQKYYYEESNIVNSINKILNLKDKNIEEVNYIHRYRVLVLIMKNCSTLSDDEITLICKIANLHEPTIFEYLLKARLSIESLVTRRDLLNQRKLHIKKKLYQTDYENYGMEKLTEIEIKNLKTRLKNIEEQISNIRCAPSNKSIAKIIGTNYSTIKIASNFLVRNYKKKSIV